MSTTYVAVGWMRHKKIYDCVLAGGIGLFLTTFVGTALLLPWRAGHITLETALIRALGSCALIMLHIVLWIGPLCRLDSRFLPLLFNRRHLGVATFLVALAHAAFTLVQFHGFGDVGLLRSILTCNTAVGSLSRFPFEWLGVAALLILFLMAATSHDFWLKTLTAGIWKRLHMLVYPCYALILGHIALGALWDDRNWGLTLTLLGGALATVVLHAAAAIRERRVDRARQAAGAFVDACDVAEIKENRAKIVSLPAEQGRPAERVAIFRDNNCLSAVSNVCAHQGGPLGEGKIVDGCITCPWHGWQYRARDGCSPPPFKEKIATYEVRLHGSRVQVGLQPLPSGTHAPCIIAPAAQAPEESVDEFFVGYVPAMPAGIGRRVGRLAAALVACAALLGAAIAGLSQDPGDAVWDSTPVSISGRFSALPYPILQYSDDEGRTRSALLVGPGKCSLQNAIDGGCGPGLSDEAVGPNRVLESLNGRTVRIVGTVLRRGGHEMIEVADSEGSLVLGDDSAVGTLPHAEPAPNAHSALAEWRGEIVDSKCYYGAMKPGFGKSHRACAVRCISGGIPPVLAVRTSSGVRCYPLLSADGSSAGPSLLEFVGDEVRVNASTENIAGITHLRMAEAPQRIQ